MAGGGERKWEKIDQGRERAAQKKSRRCYGTGSRTERIVKARREGHK